MDLEGVIPRGDKLDIDRERQILYGIILFRILKSQTHRNRQQNMVAGAWGSWKDA